MNATPARRVMSRSASAVSTACASLSMTHGPAMSVSAPSPMRTLPAVTIAGVWGRTTPLPYHGRRGRVTLGELVRVARVDEPRKQRERLRLELWVELHRDVPRMRRQLDHLDELPVERASHDLEPALGERLLVETVELVAMAVTLVDHVAAVERVRLRSGLQLARVGPQPHGAAEIVHAEQIAQLVNDVGLRFGRAFGGVGVRQTTHVPRELDRSPLESVTDAEVGDVPLARN